MSVKFWEMSRRCSHLAADQRQYNGCKVDHSQPEVVRAVDQHDVIWMISGPEWHHHLLELALVSVDFTRLRKGSITNVMFL